MKKGYAAGCERCGNESQLMMQSTKSNMFLCPECLENELKCELAEPGQISGEYSDAACDLYSYVTNPVEVTAKNNGKGNVVHEKNSQILSLR